MRYTLLLLFFLACPVQAQRTTCDQNTGHNHSVSVPDPVRAESGLQEGTWIHAVTDGPQGEPMCVGQARVPASGGFTLMMWGDDPMTPVQDGAGEGTPFRLVARENDQTNIPLSYAVDPTFTPPPPVSDAGEPVYRTNAITILTSLSVAPDVPPDLPTDPPPIEPPAPQGLVRAIEAPLRVLRANLTEGEAWQAAEPASGWIQHVEDTETHVRTLYREGVPVRQVIQTGAQTRYWTPETGVIERPAALDRLVELEALVVRLQEELQRALSEIEAIRQDPAVQRWMEMQQ